MDDDPRRSRLRTTFDGVAERYDAARPTYPGPLVADLIALAGLGSDSRVLEIGCGTGQLTVDLARRGVDVTAVELGPALAEVARCNLAPFPNARVVVGSFEEYAVAEPVDAVVAASSFHWIAPDARVTRTAAALRPGGALAVIDVRHVAGGTEAFFAESRRRRTVEVTYTADRFRALLSTFSTHIALPDENREGLLDCLAALIDTRYGGTVTKRYLAQLVVARRR